jgi:hypothetical protein
VEKSKELQKLEKDENFIEDVEHKVLSFKRIMSLAVKNTQSADWIDYAGKAWLGTAGAERVARVFGFTVKDVKYERLDRSDEKGQYYMYVCTGKVGIERYDMWIDAIGVCSSRKAFHYLDKGRERTLSEIQEGNILKDAYSNMFENGVCRFLGLRNLPWQVLAQFGINRAEAREVKFKKGGEVSAKLSGSSQTKSSSTNKSTATQPQLRL